MNYFKFLPLEITSEILTRLTTESILKCRKVCTAWRSLIGHPSFSKVHLDRLNHPDFGNLGFVAPSLTNTALKFTYFEYNESHDSRTSPIQNIRRINFAHPPEIYSFVGSCNGLICFIGGQSVWICNPIIREYVMLPEIKREYFACFKRRKGLRESGTRLMSYRTLGCAELDTYWTFGFGYVSSTNEYKVVGLYRPESIFLQVYIYTLGSTNGWKYLGILTVESIGVWDQGIFANGALYWLDRGLQMIITFDLAEEKFCERLSARPFPSDGDHWSCHSIGALDGFLYVSDWYEEGKFYDIWLLKKKSVNCEIKEQKQEQHQSSVWSREFRSDHHSSFAVTKSGGVLTCNCDNLNIYNAKTSTLKCLGMFKDSPFKVTPHRNTFVSLKELGEQDTKTMEADKTEETHHTFEQLLQRFRQKKYNINRYDTFRQLQEDANLKFI